MNKNLRLLVLWPLVKHNWNNIINFIEDDIGIEIKDKVKISSKNIDNENWINFILNIYLSHRKSDNVDTESGLRAKIDKKIKSEFFGNIPKDNRCVLVITYELKECTLKKLIKNVKKDCLHNNQRINSNINEFNRLSHCYMQNTLKDIVRNKFKNDNKLPEHIKGRHYGRKRIAHAPESALGALDILNFLKDNGVTILDDEN